MKFKIHFTAFLVAVSTTALSAQLLPPLPNPPVLQKCTNSSDALCKAAAAVYNAIIANPPVPATKELAGNVTALLSLRNNPNMPGTSLQKVIATWNSQQCPKHFTGECLELLKSLTYFNIMLASGKASLPAQQEMNSLIMEKKNMSKLNPAPFYYFVFGFNMADAAINAALLSSHDAHSSTLFPLHAPTVPAAPAKK